MIAISPHLCKWNYRAHNEKGLLHTHASSLDSSGFEEREKLLKKLAPLIEILYLFFVRSKTRHITVIVLVAGYLIVTFGGQLQALASVINSGVLPHQLTSARESHPTESRLSWGYKKHLLPSAKKVEVPTETTPPIGIRPHDLIFTIIQGFSDSSVTVHAVYFAYRPRDPPSA